MDEVRKEGKTVLRSSSEEGIKIQSEEKVFKNTYCLAGNFP